MSAGGAAARQESAPDATTEARFQLSADSEEVTHLVCCRDVSWRVALCGAEQDTLTMVYDTVCTMCVEQIEVLWPGFWEDPEWFCPVDGRPCPDEYEVCLRVARETDPAGS